MDSLIPVATGSFGSGFGAAGVGGAIGGLIGSWVGNGWNGGWGGRNCGCGCGCGSNHETVVVPTGLGYGYGYGAGLVSENAILSQLNSVQEGLTRNAISDLQGQNTTNMAMCQGFSGVVSNANQNTASLNNTAVQGFAGLNTAITSGNAAVQQSLCQGFGGLNTAVLVSSKDNALLNCQSTSSLKSAIDECCCTTQKTVTAEGSATRNLMSQIERDELLRELSDAKCKISSLENQQFTTAAIAAQTGQLRSEMAAQTSTLIQHMGIIAAAAKLIPTSSSSTPAA